VHARTRWTGSYQAAARMPLCGPTSWQCGSNSRGSGPPTTLDYKDVEPSRTVRHVRGSNQRDRQCAIETSVEHLIHERGWAGAGVSPSTRTATTP
jgi:hypothetical protein